MTSMSCIILLSPIVPELTIISLMINDDNDAIIQPGEERTVELNSKYKRLNLDDLNNFKSDATVQQWEGEDFRSGVGGFLMLMFCKGVFLTSVFVPKAKKALNFNLLSMSKNSKRERIATSKTPCVLVHLRRIRHQRCLRLRSRLLCASFFLIFVMNYILTLTI